MLNDKTKMPGRNNVSAQRISIANAVTPCAIEMLETRSLFSSVGLVGHWALDDASGLIATDSSGNGRNGTLTNGPVWTTGNIGGALNFDGSNDRVLIPDQAALDITGPITMATWLKPETKATQYPIKKSHATVKDGYELSLSSAGKIFVRFNEYSKNDAYRVDSVSDYPTNGNTWVHAAATYDGTTIRLYINGTLEASKAASFTIGQNNVALSLGSEHGGYRPFDGSMDDVRLYNRALSQAEVQALASLTPVNTAPQVSAGPDTGGLTGSPIVLDGTATDDGLPGPLTTLWSKVSGPGTVAFDNVSAIDTTAIFSTAGTYVLALTANDGALTTSDQVTVVVTTPVINQPPVVNAGIDQLVTLPAAAQLDGTVSDDGQPGPTTTLWSFVNGPGQVSFGNASNIDTTVSFTVSGTYVLRLTANDGALSTSDDVVIEANAAPVVNAGTDQSITSPALANLDGTVTDDGRPGPLSTLWTKVSGPGNVTFGNAAAIDTTAGFSLPGQYVLRLTANDGAASSSDDVVITVAPGNTAPVVDAGPNRVGLVGASISLDGTITDDGLPLPGTLTSLWTKVSGPGTVNFTNASAVDTVATFSQAGVYTLALTANDGALSASDTVTVTITTPSSGVSLGAINDVQLSQTTGEKPQSKLWQYAQQWWSVLADSSGTWVWRLASNTWQKVLQLSTATDVQADVKTVGSVAHVLLYRGTSSSLASVEYNAGSNGYVFWSQRPSPTSVSLASGVETATIDIDSTGRLWLAYAGTTALYARYSDGTYNSFSDPITIATGIKDDDIASVVTLPDGKIGIFWSNQNAKRFGFKTHVDGASPTAWSADEVPGNAAALNVGNGMGDDHFNTAVGSDGTLYVAVKTSYDTSTDTQIGLLVRRPNGVWDPQLYHISNKGTRPTLVLNELTQTLVVAYTAANNGDKIMYATSNATTIAFSTPAVLIDGKHNDVTTTKDNVTNEVIFIATDSNQDAAGVRMTFDGASLLAGGSSAMRSSFFSAAPIIDDEASGIGNLIATFNLL